MTKYINWNILIYAKHIELHWKNPVHKIDNYMCNDFEIKCQG